LAGERGASPAPSRSAAGARSPETLYDGYNETELKRLLALHPRTSTGATS
jgi:hypothetical protein